MAVRGVAVLADEPAVKRRFGAHVVLVDVLAGEAVLQWPCHLLQRCWWCLWCCRCLLRCRCPLCPLWFWYFGGLDGVVTVAAVTQLVMTSARQPLSDIFSE